VDDIGGPLDQGRRESQPSTRGRKGFDGSPPLFLCVDSICDSCSDGPTRQHDNEEGGTMSVTVKVNQHGHLAIRVRWQGRDDHIGTKLKDDSTGRNRKLVGAKATLIAEDLRKGIPLHRALSIHLGACPAKLWPVSADQAAA